ncbi:hypothetical protein K505DRAFT_239933 [Melanomma pulvis-pyrius CBS 109.77]|uniref:RTA1 like protein n=1 Tax=Melanomma pulvis-pyrius CBS 109.77 TaxID=1314802 RepID=A0A6A6XIC5_9PLEO|nr:hypothetical protein K505DRAFT_239933 [Melanomma pulvis-pyrius CBS 109.77]
MNSTASAEATAAAHALGLWQYKPSLVGAVVGASVFGILTGAHGWMFWKKRNKMCIMFILGAFNEQAGYIARCLAHFKTASPMFYSIQSMMILISPIMIAASVYMVLARVMCMVGGESRSPVPPRLFNKIFGGVDVLCLLMISVGGVIGMDPRNTVGTKVLLGGLGIHMALLHVFIGIAILWHRRVKSNPTAEMKMLDGVLSSNMRFLYAVSGLLMLRTGARFGEYYLGRGSFLQTNELPFYLYDMLPVTVVLAIGLKWHGEDLRNYEERGMIELQEYNEEGKR